MGSSLPLDPDPEIAALLDFAPVVRKCKRHDGWTPDRQRTYIVALARLGEVERAAQSLGRTGSGAFKVRTSAGGEGFADAWDGALPLFHARNPGLSRRGGRAVRPGFRPSPIRLEDEPVRARHRRSRCATCSTATARSSSRSASAGSPAESSRPIIYVRQLTFLEILFDLGGNAHEIHDQFRSGGLEPFETIGTPMGVLLDRLRRDYWREKGEPDRMPAALLGRHDERSAAGVGGSHHYDAERDGPYAEWHARRERLEALQAEAQRLWEEKAKADAEAWAERLRRAEAGAGPADDRDARA